MSALNVIVSSQRAWLLSDSSVYNAEGTIVGFDQKCWPVTSWNGAIGQRGDLWGLRVGHEIAERFASFDEFIARSGALIEQEHRRALAAPRGAGNPYFEIAAVGWSESRDRACAFMLQTRDDQDAPAYVWCDICDGASEGFTWGPAVESRLECWRLRRVGADPIADFALDAFDPVRHGIPLMEAQRRGVTDLAYFDGPPFHCVGGAAFATVVSREGTVQTEIHSWGDQPFHPIVPAKVDDAALPKVLPHEASAVDADVFWALWDQKLLDLETLLPVPYAAARFDVARARAKAGIANMNRAERRRQKAMGRAA